MRGSGAEPLICSPLDAPSGRERGRSNPFDGVGGAEGGGGVSHVYGAAVSMPQVKRPERKPNTGALVHTLCVWKGGEIENLCV